MTLAEYIRKSNALVDVLGGRKYDINNLSLMDKEMILAEIDGMLEPGNLRMNCTNPHQMERELLSLQRDVEKMC